MPDYVKIGFAAKTHGKEGAIRISIDPPFENVFPDLAVVFIEVQGTYLPFFIQHIRGRQSCIVQFEDVSSPEEAEKIINTPVYARPEDLPEKLETEEVDAGLFFSFMKDYTLLDLEGNPLGTFIRIEAYPQQEIGILRRQEDEQLIPLSEEWIVGVDKKSRTVTMDLPEGLLDL